MEEWLQYLDANTRTLRASPFQLQWNQHQLVLSHSELRWKAEVSERGVHEGEQEEEIASTQPKCGTGESSAHGRTSGGNREQMRMVPSTVTTSVPSGDKLVRIVTLTTPSLPAQRPHPPAPPQAGPDQRTPPTRDAMHRFHAPMPLSRPLPRTHVTPAYPAHRNDPNTHVQACTH